MKQIIDTPPMSKSFSIEMREGCESWLLHDLIQLATRFSTSVDWGKFGVLLAQYQGHFPEISKAIYENLDADEKEEFTKWFLLRWGEIDVLTQSEHEEYEKKWASVYNYKWYHRTINGKKHIVVDLRDKYGFSFIYESGGKTFSDVAWILCDFIHNQYGFKNVCVKEGDVIIDAGAYCGESALLFSYLLGGKCSIHSFEISPSSYETMLENFSINELKNVYPNRLALSNESGKNIAFSHVGGSTSLYATIGNKKVYTVKTVSLDDYVKARSLNRVDFIKMDIEGAEMDTLKGAEGTIKKYKPRLAISIYHLPTDPYEIPMYIKRINPEYRFRFNWYAKRNGVDALLYASIEEGQNTSMGEKTFYFDHNRFDEVVYRSLFSMNQLINQLQTRQDEKCKELLQKCSADIFRSKTYKLAKIICWPYRALRRIGKI